MIRRALHHLPCQKGRAAIKENRMLMRTFFSSKHKVIAFLGVIGALAIVSTQTAFAQSTIFNIPSTDAVPKGKVYFEFDFFGHLESHNNGGFQTYTPRVVVGLG